MFGKSAKEELRKQVASLIVSLEKYGDRLFEQDKCIKELKKECKQLKNTTSIEKLNDKVKEQNKRISDLENEVANLKIDGKKSHTATAILKEWVNGAPEGKGK